jgi:hypothetical protein
VVRHVKAIGLDAQLPAFVDLEDFAQPVSMSDSV